MKGNNDTSKLANIASLDKITSLIQFMNSNVEEMEKVKDRRKQIKIFPMKFKGPWHLVTIRQNRKPVL